MTLPSGHRIHVAPGRLRVRVPERRGDVAYFTRVLESLASCPGVEGLRANPTTASVLILHRDDPSTVERYAAEQGLFAVAPPVPPRPTADELSLALGGLTAEIDARLHRLTEGRVDARGAAVLAITGAALLQAGRGRLLPPAGTLLWYLADLLARTKPASPPGSGHES
jgi:hypothetical protein